MIKEENIFLNIDLSSKDKVLEFISKKAYELNISSDFDKLLYDLKEREKEFSTGIQDGFAIPHAKSETVVFPNIFFIKTINSIKWETLDDSDVNCIFAILVPKENENNIHLQMIAKLSVCLLEDEFKNKIRLLDNINELKEYILKIMEEEL